MIPYLHKVIAMELYQLKTFVKVADTGNLTRASEALFTSQPAISAQIKALEDELGLQLFSRTPKGMQLTASGKHLYQQAKLTLESAEQLKFDAQALKNEIVADIKTGIHTDSEFMMTGDLYQALAEQHPKISLHFLQSSSARIVQQLRIGELDAGFMFGPCTAADVVVTPLSSVPLCIAAAKSLEDELRGATLEELYQKPWIYTTNNCPFFKLFSQIFEKQKGTPPRITWADTEDAIRVLVKAGAGLSLLRIDDATKLAEQGLVSIWEGTLPSLDLNFVCLKQRHNEAAIQALTHCVKENWKLPDICQQSIA